MKIRYYLKLHSGVEEFGVTEESGTPQDMIDTFNMFYGDFILNLEAKEVTEEIIEPNKSTLARIGKSLYEEIQNINKVKDRPDSKKYWQGMYNINRIKQTQLFKAIEAGI